MNKRGISISKKGVTAFIVFLFCYAVYLPSITMLDGISDVPYFAIILMSWIGIGILVYIVVAYKSLKGSYFSLYTIFIGLSFMFNFGQCIAWAIGIHQPTEIGKGSLFRLFHVSNIHIFKAQLFFLVCIVAIHAVYMCFLKSNSQSEVILINNKDSDLERTIIYKVSLFFSAFVLPITYYTLIRGVLLALSNGYYYLYYGGSHETNILVLQECFFTCIVGLLIGSNYKKSVVKWVYFFFICYMVLGMASGDRGSWFYKLLVLLWMHHAFYKKFQLKTIIKWALIALLALYIIQAIVIVRDTGISKESIVNALLLRSQNPLTTFLFEMGGSMSVNIYVLNSSLHYPYGNSYLLGLLAMPTMKIPAILGIKYVPVSEWFSGTVLNLNYGAAFTMYAESLLNYGEIVAPLFIMVLGIIAGVVFNVDKNSYTNTPLKAFFCVSTSIYFLNMIRNTFHDFAKYWFLGCLPVVLLTIFFLKLTRKAVS